MATVLIDITKLKEFKPKKTIDRIKVTSDGKHMLARVPKALAGSNRLDIYYGTLEGIGRTIVLDFNESGLFKYYEKHSAVVIPAEVKEVLSVVPGEYRVIVKDNRAVILLDSDAKDIEVDLNRLTKAQPKKTLLPEGFCRITNRGGHFYIVFRKGSLSAEKVKYYYGELEGAGRVLVLKPGGGGYKVRVANSGNLAKVYLPKELVMELNIEPGLYRADVQDDMLVVHLDG
ncbi:hypothetical protein [Pyrococcus kukulkanii]|uniref:Uncharacterized protein n=1 Tax=Pyrococcus kukulkanii TaxID=1609559 RepID=A0ABV4T5V1_9EURY